MYTVVQATFPFARIVSLLSIIALPRMTPAKIGIAILALVALSSCALANGGHNHGVNNGLPGVYTFTNNAELYRRQLFPVDPNNLELSAEGDDHDGLIKVRFWSPNTTCVTYTTSPKNPICGNQAADILFFAKSTRGTVELLNVTNLEGVNNKGTASNFTMSGSWSKQGDLKFRLDFLSQIDNKGPSIQATVGVNLEVFGAITKVRAPGAHGKKSNVFTGQVSAQSIAYITGRNDPYQMVTALGAFTSAAPAVALPFRALSPYDNAFWNKTSPVAAFYSRGTIRDVTFSNGAIRGKVNVQSIPRTVNIVDGDFVGNFRLEQQYQRDCYSVSSGLITDTVNAVDYYTTSLHFCADE